MEIAVENILAMYAIMLAAYGLQRIAPFSVKAVNDLVFHFFLPVTVFNAIVKMPAVQPKGFLLVTIASIAILLATYFSAKGVSRLLNMSSGFRRTFLLGSTYGNHAFLGIPVAYAFLGDSGSAWSVFFLIGSYLFLYSIGYFIMTGRGTPAGFIKNPLVVSTGLGLLVVFLGVELPDAAMKSLSLVNQGTFPLSMMVVGGGLSLKFFGFGRKIFPTVSAVFIKLFVGPAAAYLICLLLALDRVQTAVCILQAAMPTGVLVTVFSVKYEGDDAFSNALVSSSTLASIATVPLILWGVGQ
ncbi:MAG: AEC family transporter [Desulfobacteraceae bacterium]|nr:MAG: AEC family transporter [Desulfobacteraceae bacterium]